MGASALVDLSHVGVLCVDGDPVMRAIIRGAVYQRGCRDFVQAANGEEALNLCSHRKFDLVISEYRMHQ